MLKQPWVLAIRKWGHHFITVYSCSLTYDISTYDQPNYIQNILKKISIQTTIIMSLKFHVELHLNCTYTVLIITTPVAGTIYPYYFTTERLLISIPLNLLEDIPYILEYNAHPFYSFRGPKSRMRIRFVVESWFLEKLYSRCTCRKNNTIQSFIILFITVGARGGRCVNATMNDSYG
jgi:hypothetical protein